jgi:hypothetical protein
MKNFIVTLLFCLPILIWARPQEITVSTFEEFLNAIGSDRTIILQKGTYRISQETDIKSNFFFFKEGHFGKELVIHGVANLTIQGEGDHESHLLAEPTSHYAILFQDVMGIRLVNLMAGHSEQNSDQKGQYFGSAVCFERSHLILIEDCRFQGSGSGITLQESEDITIKNTAISGCLYFICSINSSANVLFQKCELSGNVGDAGYNMVQVNGSPGTVFKECVFSKNRSGDPNFGDSFFSVSDTRRLTLDHCNFLDNAVNHLCSHSHDLRMKGCTSSESQWQMGTFLYD